MKFKNKTKSVLILFFTVLTFGLCIELLAMGLNPKKELKTYIAADFGFSITPPGGWRMDEAGSDELTKESHQKNKDNRVVVFVPEKLNVDPTLLSLFIEFDKSFTEIPNSEDLTKKLKTLEQQVKGGSKAKVHQSRTVSISDWKGIQTVVCTPFGSGSDCNLVLHVTQLYSPQGLITIQFSIIKEKYSLYEKEIDRVLASIKKIPIVSQPSSPKCQKDLIKINEVKWEKGFDYGESIQILWYVSVTNLNNATCLVEVEFQMIDKNGEVVLKDRIPVFEELSKMESKSIFGPKIEKNKVIDQVVETRAFISQIQ